MGNKPKRGRPALLDSVRLERLSLDKPGETKRSVQNYHYRLVAIVALMNDDRFKWLLDEEVINDPSTTKGMRSTILQELGRLEDADVIRHWALKVCEEKPSTKSCVQAIRRIRGVARKEGNDQDLTDELIGRVDDYWKRFPEITKTEVLDALDWVRRSVEVSAPDDD